MTRLREWLSRLWSSVRPARSDADLEEELRLHLELAESDRAGRLASADDARRAAHVRWGGQAQAVEALRDQRGLRWIADLGQDLRFGIRGLRRNPVFAAVIVLSLALGIGANTALFSLIDATLLRALPVDAPDELVFFQWHSRAWMPDMDRFAGSGRFSPRRGHQSPTFTLAGFEALQAQAGALSDFFAFNSISSVNASVHREAYGATMQMVSGGYFAGLRVHPTIGRVLTPADDHASSAPAAVISDAFWVRHFDRSPAAVGTPVVLDGTTFTIVGVAPAAFRGAVALVAQRPDAWIPLAFAPAMGARSGERGDWWVSVMGRRRPEATLEHVRGNLAGTFRASVLETDNPPPDDVPELRVRSARRGAIDEGPDDEAEHAVILGGIFGLLLLIVCLNVANLLLSRSAARRTEIGVRLALGASRGRLVRQLLAESLCLSVAGGALGFVLAFWGKQLFVASTWVTEDLDLRLNAGVLVATVLLSALTGLAFGLVPALRATRLDRGRAAERLEIRGAGPSRLNRWLLIVQVATAVVLLVGAGLFIRTLGHWNAIDPGFDTRNLLVFEINPEPLGDDAARVAVLVDQIAARIRAVPGVTGTTTSGSFWRDQWFGRLVIDGKDRRSVPRWLAVRHDFFDTLRLPVLAGRGFVAGDDDGPPTIAVVDENFARRSFGHTSPIGRRFAFRADGPEITIVGVVGNMWMPGTRPEEIMATVYLPARTRRADFDPEGEKRRAAYRVMSGATFEIRTTSDPASLMPAIRVAVADVDPVLPIVNAKTVAQGIQERLEPTRLVSFIWLSFGGVALVLTAIGLYGLLAYSVAQRTREIGIRAALGARRVDIIRLVTGRTLGLVAVGIAAGLVVSMGVNQLSRAFIFGVTFYDPLTIGAVVAMLLIVTSLAAFVPARRAARVDPTKALRAE